MTTTPDYSVYLRDILEYARSAQEFIRRIDFDAFVNNREKTFAVFHALEVIGEAARHIPTNVHAKYPQVPWRQVTGTRDILIHGYAGINLKSIWNTVQNDLPTLIETVEQMLQDLESNP